MLGFNALSDHAISDISLPVITGTIYAVDSNDTATLTAQVAVSGSINTTDSNDIAIISGEERVDGVIYAVDGNDTATFTSQVLVSGSISATDSDDTADFEASSTVSGVILTLDGDDTADIQAHTEPLPPPPEENDTHDGIRKDELKRIRALQKRIAKAEAERNRIRIEQVKARKNALADAIEPKKVVAKSKNKVESKAEVQIDIPSIDLRKINTDIANLERQKDELFKTIALRQEMARIQTELAILEAKAKAELDDEESVLALLL